MNRSAQLHLRADVQNAGAHLSHRPDLVAGEGVGRFTRHS
jgi:hypothetical protein